MSSLSYFQKQKNMYKPPLIQNKNTHHTPSSLYLSKIHIDPTFARHPTTHNQTQHKRKREKTKRNINTQQDKPKTQDDTRETKHSTTSHHIPNETKRQTCSYTTAAILHYLAVCVCEFEGERNQNCLALLL